MLRLARNYSHMSIKNDDNTSAHTCISRMVEELHSDYEDCEKMLLEKDIEIERLQSILDKNGIKY